MSKRAYSAAQGAASMKYIAEKRAKVGLIMEPELKAAIQEAAKAHETSVNAYIIQAVRRRLSTEERQ